MTFKEFLEVNYPVGQGVNPPPGWAGKQAAKVLTPQQVNPANPNTWPKEEIFRIVNRKFNPPEQAIIDRQKQELRQQQKELGQYGVIFTPITPFKLNGGKTLEDNPIWQNLR